jgi:hypothetical protein
MNLRLNVRLRTPDWTTPDGSPLFTLAKKLLSLPRKYAAEDAGGKELFVVASKIARKYTHNPYLMSRIHTLHT